MSIEKRYENGEQIFSPICDLCGDWLTDEYDFYDAVTAAKHAGWKSKKIAGEWRDYCPDCQKKIEDNAENDFAGIGRG